MKKLLKVLLIKAPVWFLILSAAATFTYKWVPVKYTPLMAQRAIENRDDISYSRSQKWLPIDKLSFSAKQVMLARDAAEDFNLILDKAVQYAFMLDTKDNVLHKFIGKWFSFLVQNLWSLERTMEVYLNVTEMGRGIYGIEAASEYYYGKGADRLTKSETARLITYSNRLLAEKRQK